MHNTGYSIVFLPKFLLFFENVREIGLGPEQIVITLKAVFLHQLPFVDLKALEKQQTQ